MADALDLASAILGSGVAITDANFTGKDAAVLEFDFVPTNSFLTFNYVFASEEYNEWVSTQFNDVFGFFVTDSLGVTTNIAVIPGTTTPIAINNVNSSTNPAYYLNNDTSDFGLSTTPYNTEFDGFTTGLTAAIQVIPDKKYHFKLAIADNSDGIYDSAVFITKGSFASLPLVPVTDSFLVSSYSSTPLDVLANDLVLEGKQPFIKAFDSSSINSGTVYLNDNQTPDNLLDDNLLYTPQSGFSGVDSFNYTLGDGSGNAVTGTVYIQVNMGGGVSTLSVGDVSVVENGSYEVWIPVTLTGIADQTFTVDYSLSPDTATENQDYTPVTGTLTFNPGDSIQYIVVPLQDDDSVEGNETFFVNLSNVSGGAVLGQTTGTVTITENEKYTFTYFYGNGDSYSGYGFAQLGTHGVGKLPYNYDNETGTQKGYYVIDSVEDSETGTDGYVYITSYTDADTGFGETTNIWYGGGYSGLGSEYGYAYNSDGSASDPYFTQYYEADIIRQKYTFTYFYGNGDNYSGYGFAPLGTYTEGQIIGNYINETSLYPARTGAVENNTLGYSRDSVYHLTYTFTNASDLLTLNFRGSNLEGIWNESWGLDNVKVTAGSFTHTNDFETDTVEGWSSSTRSTTPVGSRDFLGEFANDTVSLSLNHPDLANNPITLEFDLFIIGSWDGSFIPGPDYFTVETSEEQTLLNSTFGNNELQGQTYPDNLLGYYTIDSVENSETGTDGYVYITSYTDADTGFGTTTNVSGGLYAYGLGSEYGYAYNSDGNTFDPYFNSYYEADIIGQKYTFTYFYGNGDNYSGYGFAPLGTYT
ncbi:choice-of-anchor L domain-containing protein, partial [Cylindrospermopsis sp. CR12]|uniref:choice-of-anchor L domain-containing protein n=2 Tax=Cylindrospermopsis TaxID=77021 RepID=UPI0019101086